MMDEGSRSRKTTSQHEAGASSDTSGAGAHAGKIPATTNDASETSDLDSVLDELLGELFPLYHATWVKAEEVNMFGRSFRFYWEGATDQFGAFADEEKAHEFLVRRRAGLREAMMIWLGDNRVLRAVTDDPLNNTIFVGENSDVVMTTTTREEVQAIIDLHGIALKWWCQQSNDTDMWRWLKEYRDKSEAYRQNVKQQIARARAEQERQASEEHFRSLRRAFSERLDEADSLEASEHERVRAEILGELQRTAKDCPHYDIVVDLHRLWIDAVAALDERLDALLALRTVHAIMFEKCQTDIWLPDAGTVRQMIIAVDGEIARTRAAIERERATASNATASRGAGDRSSDTEAAAGASGDIPRLRLRVALTTVTRLVQAMTAAGWLPETTPVATIVGNIFAESSTARDREGSYNAAAARIKDSTERHGMILRLMIALLDEMPPDDLDALAEAIERHHRR